MPIYNTYAIHLEKKWESAVSVNFVDKDFDNPLENTDEKGLAFAGMDLCFAFCAVLLDLASLFPLEKRFERNIVEVQAL